MADLKLFNPICDNLVLGSACASIMICDRVI
jgi:hypothetical protein